MAALESLLASFLKDKVLNATDGKGLVSALTDAVGGKESKGGKKPETKAEKKEARAIRNAFTLGAPSGDREARARAMAAQAIYNDLERTNATPQELAAAKAEAQSWQQWASMSRANRENILQRGRKQAEMGAAKSQFADTMRERQTPGANELLRREAVVNAGGPRITEETIQDGRVTNRKVAGKYGTGSVVDTGKRGGGDPRLRAETEQLLLDQAARGTAPPRYDAQLAKYQRPETRAAQLAASLAPGTGAGPRDGSYAAQILADYQTRIQPQASAPVQQVAMAPVARPQVPMLMDTLKSPATSLLMQSAAPMRAASVPAAPAAVTPAPVVAPVAPQPVARTQAEQDEIDRVGLGFTNISRSPAANALRYLRDAFTPTYGG